MVMQLACDGCHAPVTLETTTRHGQLDPVLYCADCAETWATVTAELDAARLAAVQGYESARSAILAAAVQDLKALPDA